MPLRQSHGCNLRCNATHAAAATTGDAGSDKPVHEDQGRGDGSDVIMIGDSWMSLGGPMVGILKEDPDVKTVITTGGGNDILQSGLQMDCQMKGDACAGQVARALSRDAR